MAASKPNRLLPTIFAPETGATLACDDAQEVFDMAARIELQGDRLEQNLPQLAGHLASCPYCADAYRDYLWIIQEEAAGRLVEPSHYPQPDLSFLPGPLDRLRRQIGQVANEGRFWLQNVQGAVWLSLAAYAQAGPVLATVKSPATAGHLLRLTIEPDPDTIIELVADRDADETSAALVATATLVATVHRPSRFYAGYAGSTVVVEHGTGRLQAMTDDAGKARFTHIPLDVLDDMVVKVEPVRAAGDD